KPELFLKGGEKGAALTEAALKYASALANGYADPSQLHEVYTIPHIKVDVRQGLSQAIQKGDVKGWLDSLVPQTPEYRALSAAHAAPATQSSRYSPDLVAAVRKVQAEWGLKPDGVIGGATVDVLNAGPGYRARQLAIAMERLRWLPRTPPSTRIDVNTAASFL